MTQTAPSLLLLAIPQAIPFLFYLVALIYVLSKRTDRRTAKVYVVASLAIMFTTQVGLVIANIILANMGTGPYVFAFAITSAIGSSLDALAIGLLIAAAFSLSETESGEETAIVGRVSAGNQNPYAPPTP
jgi:hypothetical protein